MQCNPAGATFNNSVSAHGSTHGTNSYIHKTAARHLTAMFSKQNYVWLPAPGDTVQYGEPGQGSLTRRRTGRYPGTCCPAEETRGTFAPLRYAGLEWHIAITSYSVWFLSAARQAAQGYNTQSHRWVVLFQQCARTLLCLKRTKVNSDALSCIYKGLPHHVTPV